MNQLQEKPSLEARIGLAIGPLVGAGASLYLTKAVTEQISQKNYDGAAMFALICAGCVLATYDLAKKAIQNYQI